jgi:hypothetical protein
MRHAFQLCVLGVVLASIVSCQPSHTSPAPLTTNVVTQDLLPRHPSDFIASSLMGAESVRVCHVHDQLNALRPDEPKSPHEICGHEILHEIQVDRRESAFQNIAQLSSAFSDNEDYSKQCDHPQYIIEYKSAGTKIRLLVSFKCSTVKIFYGADSAHIYLSTSADCLATCFGKRGQ